MEDMEDVKDADDIGWGRIGCQGMNMCIRQHVIPRFVLSWFAPKYRIDDPVGKRRYDRVIFRESEDKPAKPKLVTHRRFVGEGIYSKRLDDSWNLYEGDMADLGLDLIRRSVADPGARTLDVDAGLMGKAVLPFMAGSVARSRDMPQRMKMTTWNTEGALQWIGDDAIRMSLMEAMLTLLRRARISLVRPEGGRFILPYNGYLFDGEAGALTVPFSPLLAFRATWSDGCGDGSADPAMDRTEPLPVRREYVTREHRLAANMDDGAVIGYRKKDLADAIGVEGADTDMAAWIALNMQPGRMHDWCRAYIAEPDGCGDGWFDGSDVRRLGAAFHVIRTLGAWAPPMAVLPLPGAWSVVPWSGFTGMA